LFGIGPGSLHGNRPRSTRRTLTLSADGTCEQAPSVQAMKIGADLGLVCPFMGLFEPTTTQGSSVDSSSPSGEVLGIVGEDSAVLPAAAFEKATLAQCGSVQFVHCSDVEQLTATLQTWKPRAVLVRGTCTGSSPPKSGGKLC
jgi:hypothetical protein